MTLIKRDGSIVTFDIQKIQQSILGASKDADVLLNESDLLIITNSVKHKLQIICKNDRSTSSLEVRMLVYESLLDNDFPKIAQSYIEVR